MIDATVTDKKDLTTAEKEFRAKFMLALAFYENYNKRQGDGSSSEMMARQALHNAELLNTGEGPSLVHHFLFFCDVDSPEKREVALTEAWEHFHQTAK